MFMFMTHTCCHEGFGHGCYAITYAQLPRKVIAQSCLVAFFFAAR